MSTIRQGFKLSHNSTNKLFNPADTMPTAWLRGDIKGKMSVNTIDNSISRVGDNRVGSLIYAEQTVGANQPIYTDNVINGRASIRFNGVNNRIIFPLSNANLRITNHAYEVMIIASTTSPTIQFIMAANIEKFEVHLNGAAGVRGIPNTRRYLDHSVTGAFSDGNPRIFNMKIHDSGLGVIAVNNIDSLDTDTNCKTTSPQNIRIGLRVNMTLPFIGYLHDYILWNRTLLRSERIQVVQYYNRHWSI